MVSARKTTDTYVPVAFGPAAGIWTTAGHFQRPSVPATGPRERPPVVSTTRGTSSPETCLAHLPIGTDAAPPALARAKCARAGQVPCRAELVEHESGRDHECTRNAPGAPAAAPRSTTRSMPSRGGAPCAELIRAGHSPARRAGDSGGTQTCRRVGRARPHARTSSAVLHRRLGAAGRGRCDARGVRARRAAGGAWRDDEAPHACPPAKRDRVHCVSGCLLRAAERTWGALPHGAQGEGSEDQTFAAVKQSDGVH